MVEEGGDDNEGVGKEDNFWNENVDDAINKSSEVKFFSFINDG